MCEIPGYSRYESILACYTLLCSFVIKNEYSDKIIKENWLKLQNQYPYLYDYTTITRPKNDDSNNDFSDNIPLKLENVEIQTIKEGLNKITDYLSKEIIQPIHSGMKNSLLAYFKVSLPEDNHSIYTFFSLYTSHSRTDLRSMTYLVTAFLNQFENNEEINSSSSSPPYPMKSIYPTLIEKNLIPAVEERENLIQKFFNYKTPLTFDYLHLKKELKPLTKEEEIIMKEELKYHQEPIYFVSRTVKYTPSEMQKIKKFCKENNLSVQALLDAAYLKAGLEIFNNNKEEADVISFQVIFDHRQNSIGIEKCIGNFPEAAYPYIPIKDSQKSIINIAKELTEKIKSITPPNTTSLYSEEFKRYRLESYQISNGEYAINFSFSASNIGRFKCFEDLTPTMKENFIDFTFLAGSQYPLPNTITDVSSHMYSSFNGSVNHTLHFPYAVIPSPYILRLLERIKELILNCC
ncbi:hypothetical protein BCR32DRAFT_270108 [Anaeromyces robustus]|uniref:Condensation domain-containing protein n=1 Tax=Anaeromyces robustus TaxID=1754192 RepID=A0A1Y1WXZ8_9FUNG|nr:hypothetical protein BCR32DRAFT_270108 [Anaeromyces robustus]|eukprot:ORX78383.1 hypothetical protein BCR32DRAFT_270108 [Anaeromyces robustus]